jgi:hypothetical protein
MGSEQDVIGCPLAQKLRLQDHKGEKQADPSTTPNKNSEDLDASVAIKAVKEELASCGAASQLDITLIRKSIKDSLHSLDQVLHPTPPMPDTDSCCSGPHVSAQH